MKKKEEEKIDQEIEYLDLIEENNKLKVKLEEIKLYLSEQMKTVSPSIFRVKTPAHTRAEERQAMGNEILKIINGKEE
jgi:hypothetical protein